MQARAIASSSSVGITSTAVGDRSDEILRGPLPGPVLRFSSSSMPSVASPLNASRRTAASFSPTPAVNVITSVLPNSRKIGPDVLAQPVDVDVVRQLRCRIA